MGKKTATVITVICALVFVFSAFMIGKELYGQQKSKEEFNELAELIITETVTLEETRPAQTEPGETPPSIAGVEYVRNIDPVLVRNEDCIGWLRIEGTAVDYPVMHTPEDPEYYLHRGFRKQKSAAGVPFMDGKCTMECDHLILYGHNMKNGTMFADVTRYRDRSYWENHPIVELQTGSGAKQYRIFAVIFAKSSDDWYFIHKAYDEIQYNEEVAKLQSRSLYDTGITPVYGQQLLSLSTCYGAAKDDRILVIAAEMP